MTKEGRAVFVDEAELVIRMVEAAFNIERPAGMPAREMWDMLDATVIRDYRNAASAAVRYFFECISADQPGHSLQLIAPPAAGRMN